jgi:hypothetical protein
MRVVTVCTRDVARHQRRILLRRMGPLGVLDRMVRRLDKFILDIACSHRTAMAYGAICHLVPLCEEGAAMTGGVRTVAVFASIVANRREGARRPGAAARLVPGCQRSGMRAATPAGWRVARQAKRAIARIHAQKIRAPVFVGIVTTGALQFTVMVEFNHRWQAHRIGQLATVRG